jgi:hypothetical protein
MEQLALWKLHEINFSRFIVMICSVTHYWYLDRKGRGGDKDLSVEIPAGSVSANIL